MPNEFQTPFKDYAVDMPDTGGNWGGSKDGDTSSGQGAMPKGTGGIMPEVTFVDLENAPGPNDSVGIEGITSGKSTRRDLTPLK